MRSKQGGGKFSGLFIDNENENYILLRITCTYLDNTQSIFFFTEKTSTETHKVAETEKTQTIEKNSRQKIAKERGDACKWSKSK